MGDDTLFPMDPMWNTSRPVEQEVWTPYLSDQVVYAHPRALCENRGRNCAVHNPSEHGMREWMQWFEAGRTYRVCPHGENHADPDEILSQILMHGCTVTCDGCCQPIRANDAVQNFDFSHVQIQIDSIRERLGKLKKKAEVLN